MNALYRPQLEAEIKRIEDQGFHKGCYFNAGCDWLKTMGQLLDSLGEDLRAGRVALVRLGRYAGAESKTWDELRNIKISAPGKPPKYGPQPTTAWLGGFDQQKYDWSLPFGWALLEMTEAPLAEEHFATLQDAAQNWQADIASCRQERETLRAERLERERSQLEQAEALEADAQAQATKAERRAAMSPAQLKLETLREQLENDQRFNIREPSGELRTRLTEAVQAVAEEADGELIEETKTLFEQCCVLWNTSRKKNKKLKELWGQLNVH